MMIVDRIVNSSGALIQLLQHVLDEDLRIPDRHAPPGELGRAVEDEVQGPALAEPNALCLGLLCGMHEERALAAGELFEAEEMVSIVDDVLIIQCRLALAKNRDEREQRGEVGRRRELGLDAAEVASWNLLRHLLQSPHGRGRLRRQTDHQPVARRVPLAADGGGEARSGGGG